MEVDRDGRFHQVRDHDQALAEANKAMDKKGNKILDWIYAAREVVIIINAIVLFGIVCYLFFLGV